MRNLKFQLLITTLSLLLFSCKDEGVFPVSPCDEVLEGWSISSGSFPKVQRQNDLFFPKDQIGFSVGNRGTILKTINGGQDWKFLEYYYNDSGFNENALTKANLSTCYFLTELVGFVGGEGEIDYFAKTHTDAVFLKTTDGGNNWVKTYLEDVHSIYDLIFFTESHGIGLFKVPNPDHNLKFQIRTTHDGGNEWTEIQLPGVKLASYQFIATTSRILVKAKDNLDKAILMSSSDNGRTWFSQPLPQGPCGRLYFINDDIGFANCVPDKYPNGIYQTRDGGHSWEEIDFPQSHYSIVHFNTSEEGFIINPVYEEVEDQFEPYSVLSFYEVFQTFDGGKEWRKSVASKDCRFSGLQYSPSNTIVYSLGNAIYKFEKR